jgi:arsenate reductase
MTMRKHKILFLCTGNTARSQMAEAFVCHYAGDDFEPYSAGMAPKGIHPHTVRVMEERGISLEGHESVDLGEYLGQVHFGTVVTVCDQAEQNCPRAWLQAQNHLHWSFEDPAAFEGRPEERLAKFREIRDEIDERIRGWLAAQGIALDANLETG